MKKIAVYCRVSTEKEEQAVSLESQHKYFANYIKERPDWELYKIYADEGTSGTSTKNRIQFNQMIEDAKRGYFDCIITKEVSRFARNTVDTLQYTRELKRIGVEVYFTIDHIHTMDPDAELRLTIMASIAQEESRKISERVKWGQKRRMEQGVVFGRDLLGYDVRGGKLFINGEGAKIVQLIYYKFLEEGKGVTTIAKELTNAKIPTMTKQNDWNGTTISRILKNEKYCGDLIQKKTFTPDYLTHKKKYNKGEEEKVVLKNHHKAIITREQFERANDELRKRNLMKCQGEKRENVRNSNYSNAYPLSGKIKCACCGSSFISRMKKRKNGTTYQTWRCYQAVRYGTRKKMEQTSDRKLFEVSEEGQTKGCIIGVQIKNEDFMKSIQTVIQQSLFSNLNQKTIINPIIEVIQKVLQKEKIYELSIKEQEEKVRQIQKKIDKVIDLFVSNSISKEEYERMLQSYRDMQEKWRAQCFIQKTEVKEQNSGKKEVYEKIVLTIQELVTGQCVDGTFYRNIIERIVVYGREKIEFHFYYMDKVFTDSLLKENVRKHC